MKKQRKKQVQGKRKRKVVDQAAVAAEKKREQTALWTRRALIGLPVLGVAGYFSVNSVNAKMAEADLSQISNNKPSFVQIHDPQCPSCLTLQRQARRAMKSLDTDAFNYLVANIRTTEGQIFAGRYGVPHVTILLFDSEGQVVDIIRGPSDTDSLRRIFTTHLEVYG